MELDYNAFIRSISEKTDGEISFFLGAGASVSSGIPTASQLAWEFKRKIYCQEKRIPERNLQDIELESNRKDIQDFFDREGNNPPNGSPLEYSFYFEKCFPIQEDRRAFIERKVSGINPSVGYLCLGELVSSGFIKHIWTTNFDDLVESGIKSKDPKLPLTTVSSEQLGFSNDTIKIVKFHGDFRYANLQNTAEELKTAHQKISDYFKSEMRNKGIVFIGYSGNDDSILSLLETLVEKSGDFFNKGFYWCKRKSEILNTRLTSLISKIGDRGYIVDIDSFDECIYDIFSNKGLISKVIQEQISQRKLLTTPFSLPKNYDTLDCIKLNAYEITEYPKSCFLFSVHNTLENLEKLETNNEFVAIENGNTIYAIGNRDSITTVFSKNFSSNIEIHDIKKGSSYHIGLLYKLISKGLRECGLIQDLKYARRFYCKEEVVRDKLKKFCGYEAIEIQLFFTTDKLYLLLLPTVYISDQSMTNLLRAKKISEILSTRYGEYVNGLLNTWSKKVPLDFSLGDFCIKRKKNPCFIQKSHENDFNSFVLKEPNLSFSYDNEKKQRSIHPLHGLKFYHPLTSVSNMPTLRLAVITPEESETQILSFLNSLNENLMPTSENNYILDYDGFESIYKRVLYVPSENSSLVEKITKKSIIGYTYLKFYERIKHILDDLYIRRSEFDVLVIYIPDNWKYFRERKDDSIYFDLHDSVKIYAAKKNT